MYLPSSPSDEEKYLFLHSGRLRLYLVSSVSTAILVCGMILFIKSNPYFIPYTLFAGLTCFYLIVTYILGFLGRDFDLRLHKSLTWSWWHLSKNATVDIFLPVCGEPMEVIFNTWKNVRALRDNHDGILRIFVLDDGKFDWVKNLAREFNFEYIRREGNELKKAGNLRNAFSQTTGDFFVIFDADFCPRPDFLLETLPYMFEDKKVAIVQTPQFFVFDIMQTVIEQGAGAIQELFYRLIQVNRETFKGAICVGTNAVYRRAPLVPMGGTAPIGYSEDVRTGFRLQDAGFDIKYIPLVLAKGICPDKVKNFWTQQYRWSMGSLSLMFSREFWKAKISFAQSLCYLTGMFYYLTTGLSCVFAFMPSIYLLIYKPELIHWYNLLWSIPSLALTNLYMRYWQKTKFTWAAIECRQISYYAHLFAFLDLVFDRAEEWQATGAKSKSSRFASFQTILRFHVSIILFLIPALIVWRLISGYHFLDFLPLSFLLLYFYLTIQRALARPES